MPPITPRTVSAALHMLPTPTTMHIIMGTLMGRIPTPTLTRMRLHRLGTLSPASAC